MKNYVVIPTEEYAELIDLRTRMGILAEEAKRQTADGEYYIFDERLIRIVIGGRTQGKEEN